MFFITFLCNLKFSSTYFFDLQMMPNFYRYYIVRVVVDSQHQKVYSFIAIYFYLEGIV